MYKIVRIIVSLLGLFVFFIFLCSINNCSIQKEAGFKENTETTLRNKILKEGRSHIGTRYRYAGKKPGGFDCSGFTYYIYKQNNILLNASSRLQAKQGKKVDLDKAQKGDLVFFGKRGKIDHVGIVTQNKKGKLHVIHSTNSQGIVEHDVYQILYWKKRIKFARDVISP